MEEQKATPNVKELNISNYFPTPGLTLPEARKKLEDAEEKRPEYDPENLHLLTMNITWNYTTLWANMDLDGLLCDEIRKAEADGIQADDLKAELKKIRDQREDLLKSNNQTWDDFRELTERQEGNPPIISIGTRRLEKLPYPVDKPSQVMWNHDKMKGRQEVTIKVEKTGSEQKIDIPLRLDFSKLEELSPQVKELTSYDKRVWIISDALYRAGNNIVTFDQIYKYIGHQSRLKPKEQPEEVKRINAAFSALNAEVFLDNEQEINANYKYPPASYSGAILPNKRISSKEAIIQVNGKTADGVIKILDKSDLLDFAIDRGQVAEIPVEAFQTPFQKTDEEISLEDYCLTWLIRALDSNKANDRTRKLNTLYKYFHITTAKTANGYKQRERFLDKVSKLLTYYQKLDLVIKDRKLKGYEITGTDLILKFAKISL